MLIEPYLSIAILFVGFILDAFIGDPYHWPHPIKWFGNAIYWGEKKWNNGENKRIKGALLSIVLIVCAWFFTWSFQKLMHLYLPAYFLGSVVLVFYGLANHTLIKEGLKVERALMTKGLEAGREQLKYIVGRDTSQLSAHQIRIAVLETLAENLSDGVVAPLFYFAIGGLPAMFAYKMINTLDSMIGYKSDRYKDFGMFAAKTDDVANFIPARITAVLMVILTVSTRGLQYIFKYGHRHSSPNAGYPESALAGILNCQFGGPNIYHGKWVDKPYIGDKAREITSKDIKKAAFINASVALVMVIIICMLFAYLK